MSVNLLLWRYNSTKLGTLINYLCEQLCAHIRLKTCSDAYSWRNSNGYIKWKEIDWGEDSAVRMSCCGLSLKLLLVTEPRSVKILVDPHCRTTLKISYSSTYMRWAHELLIDLLKIFFSSWIFLISPLCFLSNNLLTFPYFRLRSL